MTILRQQLVAVEANQGVPRRAASSIDDANSTIMYEVEGWGGGAAPKHKDLCNKNGPNQFFVW